MQVFQDAHNYGYVVNVGTQIWKGSLIEVTNYRSWPPVDDVGCPVRTGRVKVLLKASVTGPELENTTASRHKGGGSFGPRHPCRVDTVAIGPAPVIGLMAYGGEYP